MSVNANIAIQQNKLYRFRTAVVRAVEVRLPKVKIEFWSGRQTWVNGVVLGDY